MKEIVVSNGLYPIITQALEEMKSEQGDSFRLEEVNLSELERRTGISRAKLRRLKKDGFKSVNRSKKKRKSILDGYTYVTFLPIPQECLRDFLFWCSFCGLIHFLAVIRKNYLYFYREV